MTTENRLLAVLPRELYEKLTSNLKRVSLEQGTILHHPGQTIEALYFPINCLLLKSMKINRFGKAEVLSPDQINLLFNEGFVKPRDKALFGVCSCSWDASVSAWGWIENGRGRKRLSLFS
jgi:hypothetical protein